MIKNVEDNENKEDYFRSNKIEGKCHVEVKNPKDHNQA